MPHATEDSPMDSTSTESISIDTIDGIDTAALHELDVEPRQLLDTIDKLRYLGVDSYVELPQIIVVGDQSSGKSSVLEAISRLKFPSKSGLCTRFATELVLRTSPERKVEARVIHPQNGAKAADREQRLDGFSKTNLGAGELEKIVEEAKLCMGIGPQGNGFSQSVLRVQVHGPDLPQLTLVDLPGFFHVATTKQSAEGRDVVEALTTKYMSQKSSIILAVIAANNDMENQIVLDKAKQFDPKKERTLGVITKPDTLEQNSQRERNYINVAKNHEGSEYRFKLGWHVLRNRNERESEANTSHEDRDSKEREFFESSMWASLGSANKGIAELRSRLSSVLFDHIKQSLPEVIRRIESGVAQRRQRLLGLGDPRSSSSQQRVYLGSIASRMERLALDAVRGIYSDDAFFGGNNPSSAKKLRSRIRVLNRAFAHVLSQKGLARVIVMPNGTVVPESSITTDTSSHGLFHSAVKSYAFPDPLKVRWDDLNQEIKLDAMSEQGTELPGSMNPLLAFKLFKKQILPWEGIAARHLELVMETVSDFIEELLHHAVLDAKTQEAIRTVCVEPFLEAKQHALVEKLDELLEHHKGDYACQVDESFMSHLTARARKRAESIQETKATLVSEFNTEGVVDSMVTYYDLSRVTFTENIIILAVENCLMRKLPDIFQSTMVNRMDDEMLARLGSEENDVQEERGKLQHDLEILDRSLKECKKYRPRGLRNPSRSQGDQQGSLPSHSLPVSTSGTPTNQIRVFGITGSSNSTPSGNNGTNRLSPMPSNNGNHSSGGSYVFGTGAYAPRKFDFSSMSS